MPKKINTKAETKKNSVPKTTKSSKVKTKNNKATTVSKKKSSSSTSKNKVLANLIESYELPNKYNKTTVKVLFQTPKKLFVYWEISENDKKMYLENFGKDFFESTLPFLIVKNKTKDYSFEVAINDFANSWYFSIPDSNCEYEVELIRKNKITNISTPLITSNNLQVPNNHILFEQNRKEIFFKNVKNNTVTSKSIVNLHFMNHVGNAYPAVTFYNKFYNKEDLEKIANPTSI